MQRSEARKLEDIPRHELNGILCRFFFLRKFEKKTVTNTNQIVERTWERKMPDSRSYKTRWDTLFTTFIDRCSIFTLYQASQTQMNKIALFCEDNALSDRVALAILCLLFL